MGATGVMAFPGPTRSPWRVMRAAGDLRATAIHLGSEIAEVREALEESGDEADVAAIGDVAAVYAEARAMMDGVLARITARAAAQYKQDHPHAPAPRFSAEGVLMPEGHNSPLWRQPIAPTGPTFAFGWSGAAFAPDFVPSAADLYPQAMRQLGEAAGVVWSDAGRSVMGDPDDEGE